MWLMAPAILTSEASDVCSVAGPRYPETGSTRSRPGDGLAAFVIELALAQHDGIVSLAAMSRFDARDM